MASSSFKALNTDHLKCRAWRHSWDLDYVALETIKRRQAYEAHLFCMRCGTTKTLHIARTSGEPLKTHRYGYATNYLIEDVKSWGGRREFNRNVLLEILDRATQKR